MLAQGFGDRSVLPFERDLVVPPGVQLVHLPLRIDREPHERLLLHVHDVVDPRDPERVVVPVRQVAVVPLVVVEVESEYIIS